MKLPRIVRQIGKRVVQATPILRRHILTSTDYQVLSGIDEARSAMASSGGWLAARTVERQERAYQGLIAAMKAGEPRLDFRIAAEAVTATGIPRPRLIEIGCGSGYYSEVFANLLAGRVSYPGGRRSDRLDVRQGFATYAPIDLSSLCGPVPRHFGRGPGQGAGKKRPLPARRNR